MGNIIRIKDQNNVDVFPLTHERGVRDSNGTTLETKLGQKQDTLVSGTSIKTINNESILGSGNITVQTSITTDATPTSGSTNPVQSGGVFTALSGKQQTISTVNVTVDNNTGTPSATASVSGGTMTMAFTNLKGAPGLKGPKGDQGNPGSSVDYPFTLANNLTTDDSTVALAAPQGAVLLEGQTVDETLDYTWAQGGINSSSQNQYISSMNNRIVTAIPYDKPISIQVASGYFIAVHAYSVEYTDITQNTSGTGYIGLVTPSWTEGNVTLQPLTGTKTFVVIVKKGTAGTESITPAIGSTAVPSIVGQGKLKEDVLNLLDEVYGYGSESSVTTNIPLEQGGMWPDGSLMPTSDSNYTLRIRSASMVRTKGAFTLSFESGFNYNIFFYTSDNVNTYSWQLNIWGSGDYTGNWNGYIMFGMKNTAGTAIVPSDTTVTIAQSAHVPGIVDEITELQNINKSAIQPDGYVYDSSFIKRGVLTEELGSLSYLQAFCTYDGKYYSTDGSHISEQDSSFTQLRSGSLSLGHGNSLQLGHNGKAYVSGWDDQKVYVVDLATLAISSTLTLPTTGYTTAAIDDINGLAYIFQRDSYPDTQANYNFIVYDYVNEQIISTRKLDETFGAMQACDYYEGKIAMLYGLGTTALPSGMKVLNTHGGVLASFELDIFATTEPEGICFDRSDKRLLVSDVNKKVYRVYQ